MSPQRRRSTSSLQNRLVQFQRYTTHPSPEFSVVRAHLSTVREEVHDLLKGPSLFIVTEGSGKITWDGEGGESGEDLSAGKVFFVGANTRIRFETSTSLEVYRAFVESKPPTPPQQL